MRRRQQERRQRVQAVGAIGKSGKAGEIDGSRREDDIAIALANGDSLRAYTCFLSLLLLTSSLSSSAETLGLETSLALPALFDFLKSYTCFCHVYSRVTYTRGRGRQLASRMRVSTRVFACVRLQTRVSLARVFYLTCDLYCMGTESGQHDRIVYNRRTERCETLQPLSLLSHGSRG